MATGFPLSRRLRDAAFTLRQGIAGGSMVLRALTMIARLAILLYIARFLSFNDMTSYGFVLGGSGAMVALSGLGLDFQINRTVVISPALEAAARVRDRLIQRLIVGVLYVVVGWLVIAAVAPGMAPRSWPAALVMIGEPLLYDLQQAMIARRHALAGNALLFVRSAAWVPIVLALGIAAPRFRTIEFIYIGWVTGTVVAAVTVVPVVMKGSLLKALIREKIDWGWIRRSAYSAPVVYLSEIGFAAQMYADRYVVGFILGSQAAGKFVFLVTIANGIVPLVQASILNQASPDLILSWQQGRLRVWEQTLRRADQTVIRVGVLWVVLVGIATSALAVLHFRVDAVMIGLSLLMALATAIKIRGDLYHLALYSMHRDRDWLVVNCALLFVTPVVSVALIRGLDLFGAALQMAVIAFGALAVRRALLRRALREYPMGETPGEAARELR